MIIEITVLLSIDLEKYFSLEKKSLKNLKIFTSLKNDCNLYKKYKCLA